MSRVRTSSCRDVTFADRIAEKQKSRPVIVFTGSNKTEGVKLWALKGEKDGVCTGCDGKRNAPQS